MIKYKINNKKQNNQKNEQKLNKKENNILNKENVNRKNINDLIYNIKRYSNSKNSRNNLKSLTNKFKNSTLIKIANSSKLSNFGKSSGEDKLLIYKNPINNNNNLG